MPDNVGKLISAGFDRAYVVLLDDSGYAMGLTGAIANGSDAGCYMIDGVKTANVSLPSAKRVNITGRNRILGAFLFPPGEEPSFDLEGAVADFDLAAAVENTKVRDLGKWSIHPIMAKELSYADVFLILEMDAQSKESGSDGLSVKYSLLMKAQMTYLGPGSVNEQGAATFRFSVAVTHWGIYPWGESLTTAAEGATEAAMVEMTSDNWLLIHTFVGDNTATSFTVDETPAGDDTSDCVQCWKDGVLAAPTTAFTVVTATKTITPVTKPAAAEKWVVLYEVL